MDKDNDKASQKATPPPPTASMSYVVYFKKDADPATRPITFLYNGGPGSSTIWLHMGAFEKHNGESINLNVSADLATAMKTDPKLKVMVNGGYFDLATPFYAALYEDKHLPIPADLAKNIQYDWYQSGHMVYVREQSLEKLHANVAAFIRSTEAGNK